MVFFVNFSDAKSGGVLLVDSATETSLALNDAVRDIHLAAQGRKPDNKLNGVDIMSDDDELGLLGFNQRGDVVQAVLDEFGLFALFDIRGFLFSL